MKCPKCNKDFGEMITLCPLCFIDLDPRNREISPRERRRKRKTERVSSKSKGLLESSLFSLFRKPEKKSAPQPVKKEKRINRGRLDKSNAADYASFEINTGYSLDMPAIPDITSEAVSLISDKTSYSTAGGEGAFGKSLKPSYNLPEPETGPSQGEKAKEHYQKGRTYEKQGRLKEALLEYGQAIIFKPAWPEPYHRAGLILMKNKDYRKALDKFQEVVKLRPDNGDAYYQMGKIYLKENFKDDAEKYFKKALKSNPRLKAAKKELEKLGRMYNKVSSSMEVTCKSCGAFQPARAKFCGNCGGRVK
jgi:tetratricopeptide (TPR) repeat protein